MLVATDALGRDRVRHVEAGQRASTGPAFIDAADAEELPEELPLEKGSEESSVTGFPEGTGAVDAGMGTLADATVELSKPVVAHLELSG